MTKSLFNVSKNIDEQELSAGCCDDEAITKAKLEEMMTQKVEGAESTQK